VRETFVAGLDIGLGATGFVIAKAKSEDEVEPMHAGVVRVHKDPNAPKTKDRARMVREMYRGIRDLLTYWEVDAIFVEMPSGAKSANALTALSSASAIVSCVVEEDHLGFEMFTPVECKRAVTGKAGGKVPKRAVEAAVLDLWPDLPWPEKWEDREHAVDAASVLVAALGGRLMRSLEKDD